MSNLTPDIDYNAILKRIRNIYNNMSDEEKKYLKLILEELSTYGYSNTYNEVWLADYKEIPVDIDTFIESDYYLGRTNRNGQGVFPYWRQVMRDLFNSGNQFEEVILTGATRIGKTSTAITCVAYMLYRLMCLRDPQKYFGKKEISKFSVLFFNITKDLASGVAFREFNDTLKASPWFCLRGDTQVLTSRGYKPIEDIVGTDIDVYSWNDGNVVKVKPDNIAITGYVTNLIELELDDGTIISGTPDHQVMLSNGTYKYLKDIVNGDDLMEVNKEVFLPILGYESMYELSNLGRIKKIGGSNNQFSDIRKFKTHKYGYDSVDLALNGVQSTKCVPELVMQTFYPQYPSDSFYLRGDTHDNSVFNVCPGRRPLGDDWRDIPGTNGIFQVNSDGEIYCHTYCSKTQSVRKIIKEHRVKPVRDADGYYCVGERLLKGLGYHFVHRIVATTFLGEHPDLVVNHKDGNKSNNCVENLEWCTNKENLQHAMDTGLTKFVHRKVIEVGSQLVFKSPQKAAEYFGIYRRSVSKSIRFNEPVCNGLRFSYYEG